MTQNVHKKFTEKENELRLHIIQFTVTNERAFHLEKDKAGTLKALNLNDEEYEKAAECLIKKDGMVIDENHQVNFIYPVSALETGHKVTLDDGRSFSAMCAIDAIGAAFTFHQNTEIHSACAKCGEPVYIKIQDGKVKEYAPEHLCALTFPLGELKNWAGSC